MPQCCRCNGGGKCRNCVSAKANRRCTNCLPSRKGCCLTWPLCQPLVPPCVSSPRSSIASSPNNAHSILSLPSPTPMANPSFVWGSLSADVFIRTVSSTYSEVVHWKRNSFVVPYGNTGKKFVYELSTLYRAYAEGSALESIALKAITVVSILLLQKPHGKSKTKDYSACLERRLQSWSNGDLTNLLLEGRTLQNHLPKSGPSANSNAKLARTFSNLMFQGKTSAALQLLTQQGRGGVLHVHDLVDASDPDSHTVLDVLKLKHPQAQPASTDAVLLPSTDAPEIHSVVFDRIDASSIRSATS